MDSSVMDYVLQPPLVLAVTVILAGYYCYTHSVHSTNVQSSQNNHPFFTMCRMDQKATGEAINEVFTLLTTYYNNIRDSLIHSGLTKHQINNAYDIACKVLDSSQLNCTCLPTRDHISYMYKKSIDAFNRQINSIAVKISGSDFRTVDVLARSEGEPSGKYALNQKL